ncbi:MAG: peptidylprolyl isomerase [Ignavibacteriae bacterium]|nr:peptidylprolyl isomerase [Ignavibacteriota bacterium]
MTVLVAAFFQQSAAQTKGNPVATVETSMGKFEIELYPADAPKTVENFIGLAEKKFFDGVRIHRVVKNFVIQMGDPFSKDKKKRDMWGMGGESIWNKEFADELSPNTQSYKDGYLKGVVAMANKGPNTNTSQFFVMLRDNTSLPKNYTIFGKVVKGMEVVDKMGVVDVEGNGQPKEDIVVKKVRVAGAGTNDKK